MTSEGKSAREVAKELGRLTCLGCQKGYSLKRGRHQTWDDGSVDFLCENKEKEFLPIIEREARLSIAAALEMAAQLFDDGKHGHWHYGEISKLIRALTPEHVAHARAEHDREVREMALGEAERTVLSMWYNNYAKDIAQAIRALASATEERQAANSKEQQP